MTTGLPSPAKSDPIIIVGAGISGLSTAIHLAQRGYHNVTLLDKQPYESTLYSYLEGCDAASADINKIIRSAYGDRALYQNLSFDAIREWNVWNAELSRGGEAVPPGMSSQDALWINNGDFSGTDASTLPDFERATVDNMEQAGYRVTQLINNEKSHLKIAGAKGFGPMMQPFSKPLLGILDTTGGIALADKACRFALHKAKRLGVRIVLAPLAGEVTSLIKSANAKVLGVSTADGKSHFAAMTIIACGGWTPSLVPSLDKIAETTAGSVALFKIPEASSLRQRFSPHNFPAWSFNIGDSAEGGLYGFPVDEAGHLKIGYRGTKHTNPRVQADGVERRIPATRWTKDEQIRTVPAQALKLIRRFVAEYLPELGRESIDVWMTRLCWYTDSFDNHFVIDRVPSQEGLMVATAGSGHAFKYLPTIGSWVVDIMEGKGMEREEVHAWAWRSLEPGQTPVNKIMEGSRGDRVLGVVPLACDQPPKARL